MVGEHDLLAAVGPQGSELGLTAVFGLPKFPKAPTMYVGAGK